MADCARHGAGRDHEAVGKNRPLKAAARAVCGVVPRLLL